MAGWIKMPIGMEVGLTPGDFVLIGTQLPQPKKGAEPPIFGAFLLWPTVACMKVPLGTEVGGGPGGIVSWGPSSPLLPRQKGHSFSHFRPMFFCGQTAVFISISLAMELGPWPTRLSVTWGHSSPGKGHSPHPIFGPSVCWQNGWTDEDPTW